MSKHYVVCASELFIECRCGHISVTRFGHDAHAQSQPESNDPTEDPLFDASRWTGTFQSGLISSRAECGDCGADWIEGHKCP